MRGRLTPRRRGDWWVWLPLVVVVAGPVQAQTVEETLRTERQKYAATITPAEAHAILNTTAWVHRFDCAPPPCWGLHRAPPGGNGFVRPDGNKVRNDILVGIGAGRIYDVFIDGPDSNAGTNGRAEVTWPANPPVMADGVFVPPLPPTGGGPAPQPDPVPVDLGPIRTALRKLEGDVQALTDLSAWLESRQETSERVIGEHGTAINQLGEKVAALETAPGGPPAVPGKGLAGFASWLFTSKEGIATLAGVGALVGALIPKLVGEPVTP